MGFKGFGLSFLGLVVQVVWPLSVGKATFSTTRGDNLKTTQPYITSDFKQSVNAATWYATLVNEKYSSTLWAHPLAVKAKNNGLEIDYTGAARGAANDFYAGYTPDIIVRPAGLNAPDTRLAHQGPFHIKMRWESGAQTLNATVVKGSPFLFFRLKGGNAEIDVQGTPTIWYNQGPVVGFTISGSHYAAFAPTGSTWTGNPDLTSSLAGKDYLTIALLPNNEVATLQTFQKYAYAHVVNTVVDFNYYDAAGEMVTSYFAQTEALEGTEKGTIFGLYRHQYLERIVPTINTNLEFQSPRGIMKLTTGQNFSVIMGHNGILPSMPLTGVDLNTLKKYVNEEDINVGDGDTYNAGKSFGKKASVAQMADLIGETAKRDALVGAIKKSLEDWFTESSDKYFTYYDLWKTVIGFPASFGSNDRLADHHFHWGYFIQAAAVVARFDKEWAKQENWGGAVEMLIRDINSWDDNDPNFGRFGYWDAYEGHGWADGTGFEGGNNQESSSEAINADAGIYWWGVHTGNKRIRDMGLMMYMHETRAIEQYWWDVDDVTFPAAFKHTTVGMVWSNGGAYATWFSGDPARIHGINFLPITASSIYLGRSKAYIPKNYAEGNVGSWRDLFYEFLAYADPAMAYKEWGNNNNTEGGNSKAYLYHHMEALEDIGTLNTAIRASTPSFAVFDKVDIRTYTAYNPETQSMTVSFTDGTSMLVPAGTQVTVKGPVKPVSIIERVKISRLHGTHKFTSAQLNEKNLSQISGDAHFSLWDTAGKKIFQGSYDSWKRSSHSLNPGLYFAHFD